MHFGLIGQWRRIPANKQGVKGGIVELANAGYLLPYFAFDLDDITTIKGEALCDTVAVRRAFDCQRRGAL